jgi:hypothetical protein
VSGRRIGGVGQARFGGQGILDFILSKHVFFKIGRQRNMAGRLDIVYVHLLQLLDIIENALKLGGKFLFTEICLDRLYFNTSSRVIDTAVLRKRLMEAIRLRTGFQKQRMPKDTLLGASQSSSQRNSAGILLSSGSAQPKPAGKQRRSSRKHSEIECYLFPHI